MQAGRQAGRQADGDRDGKTDGDGDREIGGDADGDRDRETCWSQRLHVTGDVTSPGVRGGNQRPFGLPHKGVCPWFPVLMCCYMGCKTHSISLYACPMVCVTSTASNIKISSQSSN